jgi:hypothetical protein
MWNERTQDLFAQRRHVHGQHAGLRSQVGRGGPDGSSDRLCNVHVADLRSFCGGRRVVCDSSHPQARGDDAQDFVVIAGIADGLFNGFPDLIEGASKPFVVVVVSDNGAEGGFGDFGLIDETGNVVADVFCYFLAQLSEGDVWALIGHGSCWVG